MVWLQGLLTKLHSYGTTEKLHQRLASILKDRQVSVVLDDQRFSTKPPTQEFLKVLSYISDFTLFLQYMNDLSDDKIVMYDTTLFKLTLRNLQSVAFYDQLFQMSARRDMASLYIRYHYKYHLVYSRKCSSALSECSQDQGRLQKCSESRFINLLSLNAHSEIPYRPSSFAQLIYEISSHLRTFQLSTNLFSSKACT